MKKIYWQAKKSVIAPFLALLGCGSDLAVKVSAPDDTARIGHSQSSSAHPELNLLSSEGIPQGDEFRTLGTLVLFRDGLTTDQLRFVQERAAAHAVTEDEGYTHYRRLVSYAQVVAEQQAAGNVSDRLQQEGVALESEAAAWLRAQGAANATEDGVLNTLLLFLLERGVGLIEQTFYHPGDYGAGAADFLLNNFIGFDLDINEDDRCYGLSLGSQRFQVCYGAGDPKPSSLTLGGVPIDPSQLQVTWLHERAMLWTLRAAAQDSYFVGRLLGRDDLDPETTLDVLRAGRKMLAADASIVSSRFVVGSDAYLRNFREARLELLIEVLPHVLRESRVLGSSERLDEVFARFVVSARVFNADNQLCEIGSAQLKSTLL